MTDLLEQLTKSVALVEENKRLRAQVEKLQSENALLQARMRLVDAKMARYAEPAKFRREG